MANGRAGIVARVYAETLLRAAERDRAVDQVSEGLARVTRAVEGSNPFRRFLAGPQIAGDDKRAVVRSAFGERVHPLVLRFLELLIERRREPLIDEVHEAWRALLDARANRRSATVTTATPADRETLERIRRALERTTGQEIAFEERVDPSLLGGLVVRTGDLVMDASLRSRLDALRHRLRAAVAAGSSGAPSTP
jgi:F-type H+-transporting ATPase subunit delta